MHLPGPFIKQNAQVIKLLTKKNKNFTSNNYYSNTYMMSHFPKYWYFLTIGSRGRGKTYSGKKYAIKWMLKQFSKGVVKRFFWWRLTESAVNNMIENGGASMFEKTLLDKYKIKINIVNTDIFFAKDDDYVEDADGDKDYKWIHVGKVAAIQRYYAYKGNQFNDYDVIIMDELVRAESEKRTFNIPRAFINMIENVARKRKGIRVMIYANAISEMQEVKQLFGFMPFPGKFGVYKLYHKRAIIEYLDDGDEWKKEQSQTMAGVLATASEFTNQHVNVLDEKETFFIERKYANGRKYFASVKIDFGLFLDIFTWRGYYYVDTQNYTPDHSKNINMYALHRTLVSTKAMFSQEFIKAVKSVWDTQSYRFSSPMVYEWFSKSLEKYNLI